MKMNCQHVDTCLSDFWSGHHLPHVQIPVRRNMPFKEIREALRGELRQGAVMGSSDDARLLSHDMVKPKEEKRADALTRAAYAAINRDVKGAKKGARVLRDANLPSLDECEDGETVYAFFVFTIEE